jgi:hypothetical protein
MRLFMTPAQSFFVLLSVLKKVLNTRHCATSVGDHRSFKSSLRGRRNAIFTPPDEPQRQCSNSTTPGKDQSCTPRCGLLLLLLLLLRQQLLCQ